MARLHRTLIGNRLLFATTYGATAHVARAQARAGSPADTPAILCSLDRSFGPHARLTVDLRLRSGEPNRSPSAADSAAVERAGARILHAFSVAVLRIEADTAQLRRLLSSRTGIADVAYPVADTTRLDVRLQAFFTRPVTASDTTTLARFGASGFLLAPGARVLSFTAADTATAHITALAGINALRAQAMVCVILN